MLFRSWLLAVDVKKEIDGLILHRNTERKNNNIFRKESDELNDDFILDLAILKSHLGLLEEEKLTTSEGEGKA